MTDTQALAHMAAGGLYDDNDPQLGAIRGRTGQNMRVYRDLMKDGYTDRANALLKDIFAALGDNCDIAGDIIADIGEHIFIGDNVHIGSEAILYACAPLHIEDNVHIGPQVQFLTADHSLVGTERAVGATKAYGITVKNGAIIEAKAQILSGITIGEGAVVRACSIVTRDVPDHAVVSGAPAKIIAEERLQTVKLATEYDQILKDMAAGRPYNDFDPQLGARRQFAAGKIKAYTESSDSAIKQLALNELLCKCGDNVKIVPPFSMEFGMFVSIGDNTFINRGSIFLDCAPVNIGSHVMMGPNVCFFTSNHALTVEERNAGVIVAKPVTVGDNVWIGGNTTILGGVTIGDGSVIGAGSVVTRDIPAGVIAVGNPCRVLRPITDADKLLDE